MHIVQPFDTVLKLRDKISRMKVVQQTHGKSYTAKYYPRPEDGNPTNNQIKAKIETTTGFTSATSTGSGAERDVGWTFTGDDQTVGLVGFKDITEVP